MKARTPNSRLPAKPQDHASESQSSSISSTPRRARTRCVAKGGVQRARQRMILRLPFGVPLHANDEPRIIVIAQAFDHAVGRLCLHQGIGNLNALFA